MLLTAKQRRARQKLNNIFLKVRHEELVSALWAVHALQSRRVAQGRAMLKSFPPEAATSDLRSKFAIYPWRIETLINEMLAAPEGKATALDRTRFDPQHFGVIANISNKLYAVELADDEVKLNGGIHILNEMHRLFQKQYEWQSGFSTYPNLYRAGFLYGGQLARAAFNEEVGVDIDLFSETVFRLFAAFRFSPAVTVSGGIYGVDAEKSRLILERISLSHRKAVLISRELRDWKAHVSYRRSLLRQWPILRFGNRYHCPLPDLLSLRIGSGLYYDIVAKSGSVRNEISNNFEIYVRSLLEKAFFPKLPAKNTYRFKKNVIDAPDVIIEDGGKVAIIGECKATRMSFEALFAEKPVEQAARGYNEIIKGITQIWVYSAHCRLGLTGRELADDAVGVVLTLEPWLMTANLMQDEVVAKAQEEFARKFPEYLDTDRIPISFCPVSELEVVVSLASKDSLIGSLRAATNEKFKGYHLSTVHKETFPQVNERRPYPFLGELPKVWSWWDK